MVDVRFRRLCGCVTYDKDGTEVTILCDEHARWDLTNEELEEDG